MSGAPRTQQVVVGVSGCVLAKDGMSLNDYDRAVSAWLAAGRQGPRPSRQPKE